VIAVSAMTAGRGQSILVVEDNATAMDLATDVLRMADYEVWQAHGLAEAIAAIEVATPALILLDVRLGDGNGLELVKRLRSDGTHADLPILVLSADAMPDDVNRAREAGCDDFLSKPVSPRVLLKRIHDLTNGAREIG
jgi:CheY-like chemotaxis protein